MSGKEVHRERGMEVLEAEFGGHPFDEATLDAWYRSLRERGEFARAEKILAEAYRHHPDSRGVAFKLIDSLIQQAKYRMALGLIRTAMVRFGFDDSFLNAASEVRRLAGAPDPSRRKPSLSLCMIVKNEQEHLHVCLESVKSLVSEVIVVDTGSSDRTADIATIFDATVYHFPWNESFADCRNVSLSYATGDWILVMDADEALSAEDCATVRRLIEAGGTDTAYLLTQRNYCDRPNVVGWNRNDGSYPAEERGTGWYPSRIIRLFPNRVEIRFEFPVHESVQPSLSRLGCAVVDSGVVLHHYGKLDQARDAAKYGAYFELGQKKLEGAMTPEAVAELAIQTAELGKYEEAIPLWEKVLAICPGYAEGHLNLGCCHEALGRYRQALVHARQALELKPELKEAAFNCAKYEFYVGDEETAFRLINDLLAREGAYLPAVALLCALQIARGRVAESRALLRGDLSGRLYCLDLLAGHARILRTLEKEEYAARLDVELLEQGSGRLE